jgi:hypothetical protein
MDEEGWAFIELLLPRLHTHPAASFPSLPSLFSATRMGGE